MPAVSPRPPDCNPHSRPYNSPHPGPAPAERQPVVILLGWAGCQDKYLAKYSAIYSQKGCTVIRYTAPWRMVFFSETFGIRSLQTPARQLLELLFDYSIEDRPVLFHVFSNGGAMLYRYIIEALHTHKSFKNLRVAGTIFDSAPGRRNLRGGLRSSCSVACTDFTIQLFHVSLPLCHFFYLAVSKQSQVCRTFCFSWCIPALLFSYQALKPSVRLGKGVWGSMTRLSGSIKQLR
uniref:Transmembrane protein 53 n=1 Tax=Catharus ustulatus TaxID=91951 RepID=A0A8C3TJP0_CATUS